MSTRADGFAYRLTCDHCDARDVTEQHIGRCAITTRERRLSRAHGAASGIPEVTTEDLWAHLGHVANAEDATRIVRQVVDLGWRPVAGKDAKLLWRPGTTDHAALTAHSESHDKPAEESK